MSDVSTLAGFICSCFVTSFVTSIGGVFDPIFDKWIRGFEVGDVLGSVPLLQGNSLEPCINHTATNLLSYNGQKIIPDT